jgi:hypothetical protein
MYGQFFLNISPIKILIGIWRGHPLFEPNASQLARSTSLKDTVQGYAVVLNRQGEIVARVEGPLDPEKLQILRETLVKAR